MEKTVLGRKKCPMYVGVSRRQSTGAPVGRRDAGVTEPRSWLGAYRKRYRGFKPFTGSVSTEWSYPVPIFVFSLVGFRSFSS